MSEIPDDLIEAAAEALDESGLWPKPDEHVQEFKERAARAALLAVDLPALLERVEAAESLLRAVEDSRHDPARAIVKADRLAGEAIIAAHKAEVDHAKCVPVSAWVDEVAELTADRDALAAKVADAQRLLEQWRYESLAGYRFGASVDELQDLRTALDPSETP